ncbi:MAG: hypothetical protein AAF645_13505 [Myxococcota bacterium]
MSIKRPLRDMSDTELRAEADRRRRQRQKRGGLVDPIGGGPTTRPGASEPDATVRRAFASLEVSESASPEEVEAAYHRLIEKYNPEQRRGDKDKYEAALSLSRQLSRSYRTITRWFEERP